MTAIRYLIDAVSVGALYALITLGLALVLGLMRLVNFAHGDLITAAAYSLFVCAAIPFGAAVVIMVAVVVVLALLMQRVAFQPLRDADPMTLLIASFAVDYLLQHVTILGFSSRTKTVALPNVFSTTLTVGSLHIATLDVITVVMTAILLFALVVFCNRTMFGLQILAAASDFRMARLLGVRANRVIAAGFAISGLLAAAVGLILVARAGEMTPTLGLEPVLIGFAGVIIGGTGSLVGASLGGFGLGFVTILLQWLLPDSLRPFRDAAVFLLVIGFLLFRPQGLIPGRFSLERA